MSLYQKYFNLHNEHKSRFPTKVVVLIGVGYFYEVYEYDPSKCNSEEDKIDKEGNLWNEHIGHAIDIGNILNIYTQCVSPKKSYGICNPERTGFHRQLFDKYCGILLVNGYVIVKIDDINNPNDVKYYYPSKISTSILT